MHLRVNDLEGSSRPVVSANGHSATNERPVTGTKYFGSPPSSPCDTSHNQVETVIIMKTGPMSTWFQARVLYRKLP